MSKSSRSYYPRTGRRGVPQQFPIKLYGMLEVESQLVQPGNERVIKWSDTGKAFHIEDTVLFSTTILPKYFRTNKFSSFQRNLNLYGFSKVKRGVDIDMYAHNSFIRGRPELLIQLKKCKAKSAEMRNTIVTGYNGVPTYQEGHVSAYHLQPSYMISGNNSSSSFVDPQEKRSSLMSRDDLQMYVTLNGQYTDQYRTPHGSSVPNTNHAAYHPDHPLHTPREVSRSPTIMGSDDYSSSDGTHDSSGRKKDGKLDLLTFAVNCLEDSRVYS